jgi:tRNA nucleotidyltransferase (CCA-adding enzyme)
MIMNDSMNKSSKAYFAADAPGLFSGQDGKAAYAVMQRLITHGYQAYLVGGCVRNSVLGIPIQDYDIATSARPEQVKQLFPNTIDTGIRFGTVTVVQDHVQIEVTTFRSEGAYTDHRRPASVVFQDAIEDDLARRDFTMNAMAYSIEGNLIDPFGGLADIHNRTIRCVGDPLARMHEDLLRCVRAFRFAAQLNFSIESNTLQAIRMCAPQLGNLARERVGGEWRKLLAACSNLPLQEMVETDWMPVWDPAFTKIDVQAWSTFQQTSARLQDEPSRLVYLAMLLNKQEAELETWLQSLRYSRQVIRTCIRLRQVIEECRTIGFQNYTPGDQTFICKLRQQLFWYGVELTRQALRILAILENVDESVLDEGFVDRVYQDMPIHSLSELAVKGSELLRQFQRTPGPWIQDTLRKLTEYILCNDIRNEKDVLLQISKQLLGNEP